MQIVENWSRIVGHVERWTPPKDAADHGEVIVRVERVEAVKGYRNLLDDAAGTSLRVRIPASAAPGLDPAEGTAIAVDVRRGRQPGVVFANPEKLRIR